MIHTRSYIKGYPRPLLTRNDWINLEGWWDFAFDDSNVGLNDKWEFIFPNDSKKIKVPFSYHTYESGIYDTSYHPYMWYKKSVSITRKEEERIILHFEAVDYYSIVYVNGTKVGNHKGGYNRFSFDITEYVINGDNNIVVFVEDDMSKEKPRGKQRYKKENFECWYIETSGIWKTAWIEKVHETHINTIHYSYDKKNLFLNIEQVNKNNQDIVEIKMFDNDFEILFVSETNVENSFKLDLPNTIQYWSSTNPKLYDIEIKIMRNNEVLDIIQTYIGFRFISWEKEFKINETPTYLKMILDQGYFSEHHLTATEENIVKDLQLIKDMGFNGIRKHEKIESELFNYYCDVLGLYTWQEMPSPYEFTKEANNNFRNEWTETVIQYSNHPSIVTWVPFNESWGIVNIYDNSEQQKFTVEIYDLTRKLDKTRPIISNDGWEHTKSDIISLHNYAEYGDSLQKTYLDINKILENKDTHPQPPKKAFAKGYTYQSQPIMLSEFAGIAFDKSNGWGYGETVKSKDEFIHRLESLLLALKNMPFFTGYCITQLTDVQQEVNGLLDNERNPKISITDIKRLNNIIEME